MNSQITPFAFNENLLRTVTDEHGNPWFVAKDVALALDYSESSITQLANLLRHVPDEWKGITPIKTPSGTQEMLTLSEQGLYFFLGRSDKPKALPYQKWIAGDVMPTLRRTGSYTIPTASRKAVRTAFDFDSLPEDIQSLPQKIREKSLNYTMQTMRTLGIANKTELRETFIDYCRTIGDDSAVPTQDKIHTHADEQSFMHEYIKTCLVPVSTGKLSLETVYGAFALWWKKHFEVFCPSSMTFGRVLSRYYYRRKSNKMIYHGLAFAQDS